MNHQKTRTAKIKATGATIDVYQHKYRLTWINYANCKDEYQENELTFLN